MKIGLLLQAGLFAGRNSLVRLARGARPTLE
jgi:hypothetical protein